MAKDPYKLLGVSKSASDADIRKAYRALAKKLHPDVNPGDAKAAERFKEITAAYTLLSDPKLRKQYDTGQVDASGQQQNPFAGAYGGAQGGGYRQAGQNPFGGGAAGMDDMADLFSSLFGMQMGGQRMRGGPGGTMGGGFNRPQKGADIRYKITISLPDALRGGPKTVTMSNGKALKIKIPAGVEDGKVLRLKGKGQTGVHGGPPGDAKVEISVKPHKYYTRDGDTLRVIMPVSLREAILGGKVTLPMPTGRVSLNIPAGTNSGKTFRLKGKGLNGGDVLATVRIVVGDPNDPMLQSWAEQADEKSGPRSREALTK